jgi:hypothetical protein
MSDHDDLRRALDDLPRDIAPRRDLWGGIESRLDERSSSATAGWRQRLAGREWQTAGLLVAATVAVVVITGLGRQGAAPVDAPRAGLASGTVVVLQADYDEVRGDLLTVLDQRCADLPDAACHDLRSGLETLDRSATDLGAALRDAPAGSPEERRLAVRYRRTIERARGLAGRVARF